MSKSKERLSGKPFEELIYKIYKELEPHAVIKKNDKIQGLDSGTLREIDISVRHKIAEHDVLMIIQAKDHKKSVDIKIVDAFDAVIRDIRANRGILICNAGFTKNAKAYAKNKGIDLMSAYDASHTDWQTEIRIPVIRRHLSITHKLLVPFEITKDMKGDARLASIKLQVIEGADGILMKKFDGRETSFIKEFSQLWEVGKIESNSGKHRIQFDAYLDLFADTTLFAPKPTELEYECSLPCF